MLNIKPNLICEFIIVTKEEMIYRHQIVFCKRLRGYLLL